MFQGSMECSDNTMEGFRSFLKMPITKDFVDILTLKTKIVLGSSNSIKRPLTPPLTPLCPGKSTLPKLTSFIRNLIIRSRVQPATLFGTMVYLERLKSRFQNIVAKHECAPHRVMLAALIVAGKFLNDSSPKNKHWASYSQIFHITDINLMEKQMLEYLNFDLIITKDELLNQYSSFSHLPHSPRELAVISSIPFIPNTPKSGIFPPSIKTPLSTHFPDLLESGSRKYHKKDLLTPIVLSNIIEGNILPSPDSKGNSKKRCPYSKPVITKLNHPSKSSTLYQRRASRKKNNSEMVIPAQSNRKNKFDVLQLPLPTLTFEQAPLSAPLFKHFSPNYKIKSNFSPNNLTLPPIRSIMDSNININTFNSVLLPRSG